MLPIYPDEKRPITNNFWYIIEEKAVGPKHDPHIMQIVRFFTRADGRIEKVKEFPIVFGGDDEFRPLNQFVIATTGYKDFNKLEAVMLRRMKKIQLKKLARAAKNSGHSIVKEAALWSEMRYIDAQLLSYAK